MNGGACFEKTLRPLRLDSPLQLSNFTNCLQFFSDRLLVLSVEMYGNETPLGMMLLIILKRPKSLTLSLRLDNVDHINTCRTSSWDFLSVLKQQP